MQHQLPLGRHSADRQQEVVKTAPLIMVGGENPKIILFFSPASLIFALQMRPLNVCKMKQAAEFRSFLNSYLSNENNTGTVLFSVR